MIRRFENAGERKTYKELSRSDDFMFGKIMRNPDCCNGILERLLNIKIAEIEYPKYQKTIDISAESRSVRLDVYVEDKAETVYNVEIQAANTGELPKRARYYSDLTDLNLIEMGTHGRGQPAGRGGFSCPLPPCVHMCPDCPGPGPRPPAGPAHDPSGRHGDSLPFR